ATASAGHNDPDRQTARRVYGSSRVAAASANELVSYRPVAVEILELRCERPFPTVPVRVLVGMDGPGADGWLERQQALAAPSPLGGIKELRDARHLIAADRPDAVAAAVREVAG